MEVQEAIPGTTGIISQQAAFEKVRGRLHPEIRIYFRTEMIRNLDDEDREQFINKANQSFDRGFVEGMRGLMCSPKACSFLLWFVHQSIDISLECGYCLFMDSVYDILDSFLEHPHQLHGKEVKT